LQLDIINENAYVSVDVELLEEGIEIIPGMGQVPKLKFRAKLQEAGVLNNNGRTYPSETLQEIVNQLASKASERKLLGEFDHPSPQSSDLQARLKRSSTISLQNVCVLFTKLEFDGKFIIADCETLTNEHGINLYRLLKDKVSIGFSLRAFGSSAKDPITGATIVKADGLKALTFDVVSNPSHSNAVIYEFINESTNIMQVAHNLMETKQEVVEVLLENEMTTLLQDPQGNCLCSLDGSCVQGTIQESVDFLLDNLLEQNTIKKFKLSF